MRGRGARIGEWRLRAQLFWGSALTYAVLRKGACAVRLAMNAARRDPRAQGMTVSFLAAVSTIDLMKRVLVFMSQFLSWWRCRLLPLLEDNLT